MQQAHKLEPFLMSSVSRCVLGHPEGEIEKVKSTDEEVREGVKFCDDNKYIEVALILYYSEILFLYRNV